MLRKRGFNFVRGYKFLSVFDIPNISIATPAKTRKHKIQTTVRGLNDRRDVSTVIVISYNLKSSRMRLICERLTGISVCFLSFIFSMKVDLNHGTTSLM